MLQKPHRPVQFELTPFHHQARSVDIDKPMELLCDELVRLLIMARKKDLALSEHRKEEILRGAARIFQRKGFHAARTEEICAETGLSPGTLFRYFPDKRAIILAIMEIEFASYMDDVNRLSTKEGLHRICNLTGSELLERIRPTEYNLSADSWLELARDAEKSQQLLKLDRELRTILTSRLAQGQSEGWVRESINPAGAANVILAIIGGLIFDQGLGVRIDAEATASALGDILKTIVVS